MNGTPCEDARELIPDLASGRVDPERAGRVERHVAGCSECAMELALAEIVFASRPEVPAGLAARVSAAVRSEGNAARPRGGAARSGGAAVRSRGGAVRSHGEPLPSRGKALRSDPGSARRPWWGVAAAATAAVALGIGIRSGPAPDATSEVPGYASEMDEGVLWISEDGLLAGAPSLDGLSDEALVRLLDELSAGAGGGAA